MPVVSSQEHAFFDRFLGTASPELDLQAIRHEWLALTAGYSIEDRRLPLPVWARRGLAETGAQAWQTLCHDVPRSDPHRALCVYLHVPFCPQRCHFCDCYSFPLRQHQARHIDRYLDLLLQEIQLWSELDILRRRPVSTIHLGGGTPTFLGPEPLARLVRALRDSLNVRPETEWALESTSSELTTEMCAHLADLGFTRLHIGVQSLDDPVRQRIGRREPAAKVMFKIASAVDRGWVVSADLILGLPGQTPGSVLGDIATLEGAGIDGCSLYELQLSSRNRRFAAQHGLLERSRLPGYLMFQAASRRLAALGYRKTLFNHFARARDTNLYFTFPERGEDCLALGAIADGVMGDYHYRHPEFKPYCQEVDGTFPGLQGGLRRNENENRLHPMETALLASKIPVALIMDGIGSQDAERLLARWQASALIRDSDEPGCLALTANGSWFVGQMMAELASSLSLI